MQQRKILFLTGSRAEYDIIYPVIKALSAFPAVKAEVVACAAHLSPFHGMGVNAIRQDGIPLAATIESLLSSDSREGRALSFAGLFEGLTRFLAGNPVDVIFVAGDREEALAGALVGNFLRIHVAHVHGGDRCLASDVDELFRHAISKLAHLHFTATEDHRSRLIRMGEPPECVWNVGAPGLDSLRDEPDVPVEILSKEFSVDVTKPFFIVIYHPSPSLVANDSENEMAQLLKGVLSLKYPVFCSYPNFDPGYIRIREAIDRASQKFTNLIVYHNLPRDRFVSLYRRCAAIVGNSSSIVIESGFLKVPGILVGQRQDLREVGPNVLRVPAVEKEVRAAGARCLADISFLKDVRTCPSIYGDGRSGPRIANILASASLSPDLLLKTISY